LLIFDLEQQVQLVFVFLFATPEVQLVLDLVRLVGFDLFAFDSSPVANG
jgi:hypothetical protein